MKSLLLVLSIVLTSLSVSAQNWSLVMPNDTLVYIRGDRFIHTVWIDSIHTSSSETVYHINQIAPGEFISQTTLCQSYPGMAIWNVPNQYFASKPQFYGKTISNSQNKWTINLDQKDFEIYPESSLNFSWVFDSLNLDTATVTSIGYEYLDGFEISDSVKTITMGIYELRISKNFGIVEMNDFRDTTTNDYNTFSLIGVQNLNKGQTIPMGLDFFNFSVGDRFSYSHYEGDSDSQYSRSWYEQVILKTIVNDTIVYTLTDGTDTFERKFSKGSFPILNNFPNTLGYIWITNDNGTKSKLFFQTYVGFFEGQLYKGNTIFEGWPTAYSSGFCESIGDTINSVPLEGDYFRYSEGLGLVTKGSFGLYSSSTNLVGYIKNGDTTGVTITGLPKIEMESDVKIYPNPSNEILTISLGSTHKTSQMKMYNLQGQLILSQNFEKEIKLDVSNQPAGVYFITIANSDNTVVYREKIVIQ